MPEGGRTLRQAIASLADDFRQASVPDPEVDARLLVLAAAGADRLDLIREPGRALSPPQEARLAHYRQRRIAREPASRILGRREFWSLDLEVTPDVLDPRPETEMLVAATLDYLRRQKRQGDRLTILDLGTGSGAILISLLRELPRAFGVGVDVSESAARVARRNAERHAVGERAKVVIGDWAEAITGPVDVIVSNPPYLTTAEIGAAAREVRDYDPRRALDGGADGLSAYRAVVAAWQRLRHPPMLLEIGSTQGDDIVDIIKKNCHDAIELEVTVGTDLAGLPRIVAALPHTAFPR